MLVKIIVFDDVEEWGIYMKDFATLYFTNADDEFVRTVQEMTCPFDIANYVDTHKIATQLTSADDVDIVLDMRDKIDIEKATLKMLKDDL